MELAFRRDFEEVRTRWASFWAGNYTGRPFAHIEIARPGYEYAPKPRYMAGAEGDFEPVIEQLLRWGESREFLGELLPFYSVEFGPDHFASFLGTDMKFDYGHNTSWGFRVIEDWDDFEIKFNPETYWWERTIRFIRALRARCDGRILITPPTLIAGLDALATLRGAQDLLVDMMTEPERVHGALAALHTAYKEVLDLIYREVGAAQYGSLTRHGIYKDGIINVPQCDLSCMIGTEMYDEFALPFLQFETACLDAAEYHLDGSGAIRHLNSICSVEKIGVVQWVPSAGAAQARDWTDLHIRIDGYGKGQIFWCTADVALRLAKLLTSNRLIFCVNDPNITTRYEAEKFLEALENARR